MYKEWLTRKTTVNLAEIEHLVRDSRLGRTAVPFGFCNERWKEFTAQMRDGDELWEFSSPRHMWVNLAGRAGIALVRDGEIVATMIMRVS